MPSSTGSCWRGSTEATSGSFVSGVKADPEAFGGGFSSRVFSIVGLRPAGGEYDAQTLLPVATGTEHMDAAVATGQDIDFDGQDDDYPLPDSVAASLRGR